MSEKQSDDGELVRRYLGGETHAFERISERHAPMVYRACRRLLGDAHEAEDATQAVFVILANKAARFHKGGDLADCPEGTLGRRAYEGLERLRSRLGSRGAMLGSTALAGLLLEVEALSAVPATLVSSATAASTAAATVAAGTGAAKAIAIAEVTYTFHEPDDKDELSSCVGDAKHLTLSLLQGRIGNREKTPMVVIHFAFFVMPQTRELRMTIAGWWLDSKDSKARDKATVEFDRTFLPEQGDVVSGLRGSIFAEKNVIAQGEDIKLEFTLAWDDPNTGWKSKVSPDDTSGR